MTARSIPYIILAGFLFGATLIVSRFGIGQFGTLAFVGLRLSLASVAFLLIYLFSIGARRFPRGRQLWKSGALLGVFDTALPMSCILFSLEYQSSGVTAVLFTISPAVTVVLAHFFLSDERLNSRKLVGVLLALAGAALLALRGESGLANVGRAEPTGYLLVLIAVLSVSAMTIYARRAMRGMDPFQVGGVRVMVAAGIVMPIVISTTGFDLSGVDVQGYLSLAYTALFGTVGSFTVAFFISTRFGATASAAVSYIIPVVAGVGGVLFLGETVTAGMAAGILLILSGIALLRPSAKSTPSIEQVP